jgi:hypothetical protein
VFAGVSALLAKQDHIRSTAADSNLDAQTRDQLISYLAMLEQCAQIFGQFRLDYALAKIYCDAAEIYDVLGDPKNCTRLAQDALEIADAHGLRREARRAQDLIDGKHAFSSLIANVEQSLDDSHLASLDEASKTHMVDVLLSADTGVTDVERMRKAVEADVDDLVVTAEQRTQWCRHVQIIQDLRHEESLDTFYQQIPAKWIVCQKLRRQSLHPGKSFAELWPFFKGVTT